MKTYIITYFDGWYWHHHLIPASDLKQWQDDSFRDGKEYRVFVVEKEITIEEFLNLA